MPSCLLPSRDLWGKNNGAEDLSSRWLASSRRLSARVPRCHRESTHLSSSPNSISVPPRLRVMWSRASDNEMDNSLSLAASDAEELSMADSMADPMVFTGTPSGSPPMLVPLLPRSARRAHEILACALFISHPPLFFSRSHFLWRRWRKRIQASASSGWVRGCTSLPAHGYWMEGEGDTSIQAMQSYICASWTCLLSGWTGCFSAALDGCASGLSSQDARQRGCRSGFCLTQEPEKYNGPDSACHKSYSPSNRTLYVHPHRIGVPPLAHDDGDERGG